MSDQKDRPSMKCPTCDLATFLPADKSVHGLPTVETSFCSDHESSDLKFYCETCDKVICAECTSGQHRSHSHDLITDVFKSHKEEIEAKLRPLNDKLVSVSKALVSLGTQEAEITKKEELIESGISNMIGMIKDSLEERREKLCGQLHTVAGDKLEEVSLRKSELTIIQAQLSSCLGFIKESLRTCSEEEVLMMKSTLFKQVEILLNESKKFGSMESGDSLCMKLSASPQALMEKCLEFGKIITGSSCDSPSPIVSSKRVSSTRRPLPPLLSPDLSRMLVQRLGTPILTLTDLKGPCGVAVSQNGDVVVTEGVGARVTIFSPSGEKKRSFGKCGTSKGEFICPSEVDIDDEGNILVVDGSNRRIQKFNSDGKFLATIGSSGIGLLEFTEPDGIAINPVNRKVYVVDNNTHRIQILNPDLTFSDVFGKEGNGRGYMRYPWGIACSCSGEVYVTDSGNCCVQVFSPDGKYLREFGGKGKGRGQFLWPTGISISTNGAVVYVSEYGNHRVSVFTSDGRFLKSFGARGTSDGQFGNLRGVKVDGNGLVYVCDTDNNRVVLY